MVVIVVDIILTNFVADNHCKFALLDMLVELDTK